MHPSVATHLLSNEAVVDFRGFRHNHESVLHSRGVAQEFRATARCTVFFSRLHFRATEPNFVLFCSWTSKRLHSRNELTHKICIVKCEWLQGIGVTESLWCSSVAQRILFCEKWQATMDNLEMRLERFSYSDETNQVESNERCFIKHYQMCSSNIGRAATCS